MRGSHGAGDAGAVLAGGRRGGRDGRERAGRAVLAAGAGPQRAGGAPRAGTRHTLRYTSDIHTYKSILSMLSSK